VVVLNFFVLILFVHRYYLKNIACLPLREQLWSLKTHSVKDIL